MKHLQPMFIVPKGFSEANAKQPATLDSNGRVLIPEKRGFFRHGWEAVHLHSAPGAYDATHELLTCQFWTHEDEEAFLALPDVLPLPDVLEHDVTITSSHHSHFQKIKNLQVLPSDNAYKVRKKVRNVLQKGF